MTIAYHLTPSAYLQILHLRYMISRRRLLCTWNIQASENDCTVLSCRSGAMRLYIALCVCLGLDIVSTKSAPTSENLFYELHGDLVTDLLCLPWSTKADIYSCMQLMTKTGRWQPPLVMTTTTAACNHPYFMNPCLFITKFNSNQSTNLYQSHLPHRF